MSNSNVKSVITGKDLAALVATRKDGYLVNWTFDDGSRRTLRVRGLPQLEISCRASSKGNQHGADVGCEWVAASERIASDYRAPR